MFSIRTSQICELNGYIGRWDGFFFYKMGDDESEYKVKYLDGDEEEEDLVCKINI